MALNLFTKYDCTAREPGPDPRVLERRRSGGQVVKPAAGWQPARTPLLTGRPGAGSQLFATGAQDAILPHIGQECLRHKKRGLSPDGSRAVSFRGVHHRVDDRAAPLERLLVNPPPLLARETVADAVEALQADPHRVGPGIGDRGFRDQAAAEGDLAN